MTRTEIARLGGRALAAKVSNAYFEMIGRRGGYKYMFNEYTRLAREYDVRTSAEWGSNFESWTPQQLDRWNRERREEFAECAERYRLEAPGNAVMTELWASGNCEPKPKRRRANTDLAKLRRWEKAAAAGKSKKKKKKVVL